MGAAKTNNWGHQVLILNVTNLSWRLCDAIISLLGPILTLGVRKMQLFDLGSLDSILLLPLWTGKSQWYYASTFSFVFFLCIIILISDYWRLVARRSVSRQNGRFILLSYGHWIHDDYLLGAGSVDFNGCVFWWWTEASLWLIGIKWISCRLISAFTWCHQKLWRCDLLLISGRLFSYRTWPIDDILEDVPALILRGWSKRRHAHFTMCTFGVLRPSVFLRWWVPRKESIAFTWILTFVATAHQLVTREKVIRDFAARSVISGSNITCRNRRQGMGRLQISKIRKVYLLGGRVSICTLFLGCNLLAPIINATLRILCGKHRIRKSSWNRWVIYGSIRHHETTIEILLSTCNSIRWMLEFNCGLWQPSEWFRRRIEFSFDTWEVYRSLDLHLKFHSDIDEWWLYPRLMVLIISYGLLIWRNLHALWLGQIYDIWGYHLIW